MAHSYEQFNGDAVETDFAVNKPYIDRSHITLLVSSVSVSFTWVSDTLIRADSAPASGTLNVQVTRTTPIAAPLVDFEDASTITEANLDLVALQALYVIQESVDAQGDFMTLDTSDNDWDGETHPIKNVTAPTSANDVATKTYVDALAIADGNVVAPANPADDGKVLTAGSGAWTWAAAAVATEVSSTTDTAAAGPTFTVYRNRVTVTDADEVGVLAFDANDSGGAQTTYAKLQARIDDTTDTTEDGSLGFFAMIAGTLTEAFRMAAGLVVGVTQTDQGAGTLNADALYDAGTRVRAVGLDTMWVPAGAMISRTTNGAASGLTESTTNKIMRRTYNFDAATQEHVQFQVVFPKSWDLGTVTAEFVWGGDSSTGDVIWGLQGVAISDDGVYDTAFGTAQEVTDTLTATTDIMKTSATSAITIGNTPADDDWVCFQAYRKAADAGDTFGADAKLLGVKIKFTRDAKNDA